MLQHKLKMHYLQRLNYIKDAVTHKASEAKEVVEDKATESERCN